MAPVRLPVLDQAIDERVNATRAEHAFWPCAKGCDLCCRSLPVLPTISRVEWERLEEALLALEAVARADFVRRVREAPAKGPLTCPVLDRASGACRTYEARPIACRTYGYYTERDGGLHCGIVTEAVAAHEAEVVWGNGEAVARTLRELGEARSLAAWLDEAGWG